MFNLFLLKMMVFNVHLMSLMVGLTIEMVLIQQRVFIDGNSMLQLEETPANGEACHNDGYHAHQLN